MSRVYNFSAGPAVLLKYCRKQQMKCLTTEALACQ